MFSKSHFTLHMVRSTYNQEEEEEMIPLMMHSTHFIYGFMALDLLIIRKEGNVLFNNTLITFYLQLYGIRHGKGPLRQRERKPTATTWHTLSDQQQGFFYMHHPTNTITQPLLHQLWSTGWNEKQLYGSIMKDRSDNPLLK